MRPIESPMTRNHTCQQCGRGIHSFNPPQWDGKDCCVACFNKLNPKGRGFPQPEALTARDLIVMVDTLIKSTACEDVVDFTYTEQRRINLLKKIDAILEGVKV